MNRKAIIFGVKGTKLSFEEKIFFKEKKPWGIILFSRNILSLMQLKELVNEIKNIFHDKKYPILIDQEGGRVSRLDKIINFDLFSQEHFGKLYINSKNDFFNFYRVYVDTVSYILKYVGIIFNTLPVLN
jgi:beta-N-acetylhexosaminidase